MNTTQIYAYGNDGCVKTIHDRDTFVFEHYPDGKFGFVLFREGAFTEVAYGSPIGSRRAGWLRNTTNYGWIA